MRQQFHVRPVGDGRFDAWDMHKIIELAKDLPVEKVPLSHFQELDEDWWYQLGDTPTPRSVADHMRLVENADLSYPVVLCSERRLMDGMHRVVKAMLAGHTTIDARILPRTPPPDWKASRPDDLPKYDD
jgi:hypothetical protein